MNPYRPFLADEEDDPMSPFARPDQVPEMPPPMSEVDIPDPYAQEEQPQSPLPSSVLPFQSLPNPSLDMLRQHTMEAPTRDQYEPGTGRKVLSAIAGGLAGLRSFDEGNKIVREIQDAPFQDATADWTVKNKALEATAAQEGKTLGESVAFHLGSIKDETARKGLEVRGQQIKNNYEVGMKNARTAEERNQVLKAAQAEAATYHQDLVKLGKGRVTAETEQAHAATTRAGASVTVANASAERAKKGTTTRSLSPLDSIYLDRIAQDKVMAEFPEAKDFIDTDDNGKILGWKDAPSDGWFSKGGWTPAQAQLRAKIVKRYDELRAERLKELNSRSISDEPPQGIFE